MARSKCTKLLFLVCCIALSISCASTREARKMFGGYRIAPKICQPTNPSRIRTDAPSVCMFNYECSRRKGEVVGACMDGFLFGACCQLPSSQSIANLEKITANTDDPILDAHEVDHVPDIPILLNSDGTPIDSLGSDTTTKSIFQSTKIYNTKDSYENAEKPQIITLNHLEKNFSTLLGNEQILDALQLPSLISHSNKNTPSQDAYSPVTTLPIPDKVVQVVDPVDQLPALFSQMHKNNSTGPDTILLNKNGSTLQESLNPDEIFKPATTAKIVVKSPQTQSTAAWPMTNKMSSDNEGILDSESFAKTTPKYQEKSSSRVHSTYVTKKKDGSTIKGTTLPISTKSQSSTSFSPTTPMSLTTRNKDEMVRIPTVNYDGQSGNKKHDELDKEEIAINHIISLLNNTSESKVSTQATNFPTTWTNSERPPNSLVKIISSPNAPLSTKKYGSSSNYYYYNTVTEPSKFGSSYYTSSASPSSYSTQSLNNYHSTGSYSSRPTTNPPAPTVIVLGPLGTEYTTTTGQSTPSGVNTKVSDSIKPSGVTKKPGINQDTTLTHNFSTVISGNKQVFSVSYISVNLKDGTTLKPIIKDSLEAPDNFGNKVATKRPSTIYTTLTTWSEKPSFHLKPLSPTAVEWTVSGGYETSSEATRPGFTTAGSNCDEGTAAVSDDINNFPPVRHPDLESTVTHSEKPTIVEPGTIVGNDAIRIPTFVEDADLNKKVDGFVKKIVQSLQGNFQELKDVVYHRKNVTNVTTTEVPVSSATTPKPVRAKPTTIKLTRPTKSTTTIRTPTVRPKPSSTGTKKPVTTTKRTKPVKKITSILPNSDSSGSEIEATTAAKPIETTTKYPQITPNANFRSICGIRPHMKTGRVVGGKGATFGEWPWQVLVREATWLGLFTKNKCGGVLITDKFVITAAHCQPGFLASLVAVFGEFDISGELEPKRSVTRNVKRVIVHRAYDPATFENDLALLELESPIQFDTHIVPICMPDEETNYVNRMATVTGWGRLKYNGGVPSVLQEVKVPIMENSVCQEMFQAAHHSKLILDSFMCAGYANGEKDSCEGDSGGPLTLQRPDGRWILVGTVSHGIKCAAPYMPGVYMRITYFKPWLQSVTGV